jgi:5-methylcytosine-specific restriction endonuclease McrA
MPSLGRRCLGDAGPCADGGRAVEGRSRCRNHGGNAWARVPRERLARYRDPLYQRNRALAIAREPTCHWGMAGCTGRSTTADHLISLARGGDNSLENLVGACSSCNQRRGGAEGRATVKRRAAESRRRRGRP